MFNNIDFGLGQYAMQSGIDIFGRIMGSRVNAIHMDRYSPQMNLYRHGTYMSSSPGGINTENGPVAIRCYEPHWEWNPNYGTDGEWVFRLAQPVIGIDAVTIESGNFNENYISGYPKWSNEDVSNMYNFERKYKINRLFTKWFTYIRI